MTKIASAHPATIDVGGKPYLRDAKGNLVPVETVKATDLLMDETVRKIMGFARELSAQMGRFKGHTFEDVNALQALFRQEYDAPLGGAKGNITLTTFDGLEKVQVQVADLIEFGPELQAAKALIDECLVDWSADSHAALRALVSRVFSVEKEGHINRAELFMLMRFEIDDERWQRAMKAIRDSIRVIGSKAYVRFYERGGADEPWQTISIDLARV
ncbi:sulfate transporter [Sphingopyxis sp. GW247-27LB]|nr:sulfate transporter [Sphingopyxis sp. GW247-27LB]